MAPLPMLGIGEGVEKRCELYPAQLYLSVEHDLEWDSRGLIVAKRMPDSIHNMLPIAKYNADDT